MRCETVDDFAFWFWLKRINCLFAWIRFPPFNCGIETVPINPKNCKNHNGKNSGNDCIQFKLVLFWFCFGSASVLISNYENVYAIESSWVLSCVESSLESRVSILKFYGCSPDTRTLSIVDSRMALTHWYVHLIVNISKYSNRNIDILKPSLVCKLWTVSRMKDNSSLVEIITTRTSVREQPDELVFVKWNHEKHMRRICSRKMHSLITFKVRREIRDRIFCIEIL